jgi:hypothetical protein
MAALFLHYFQENPVTQNTAWFKNNSHSHCVVRGINFVTALIMAKLLPAV